MGNCLSDFNELDLDLISNCFNNPNALKDVKNPTVNVLLLKFSLEKKMYEIFATG